MADRMRLDLSNGDTWFPDEVSNAEDGRRVEAGRVVKFIRYRKDGYQFLLPADMKALKYLSMNGTILTYQFGKAILSAMGYFTSLNTTGERSFSGHKVCKRAKPNPVSGITYPDSYRVLKPISNISLEGSQLSTNQELLFASVFLACEKLNTYYSEEIKKDAMEKIINGSLYGEAADLIDSVYFPPRTPRKPGKNASEEELAEWEEDVKEVERIIGLGYTYKIIRRRFVDLWKDFEANNAKNQALSNLLSESIIPHKTELIDVDGIGGSMRFLPKKEWFDQSIQDNVSLDLLFAFPEAEREVFALFLGRTVAGRLGQVYTSGKKQNVIWRGMPVLVDTKGGIGKSTLAEKIITTLNKLGYTFGEMPPNLAGEFGLGRAARADISYVDDCDKSLPDVLTSKHIKTLVSNSGNMSVHEKGEKHVTVKFPRCTLMIITNRFELHKMDLDGGNISRILPMKLWTVEDLATKEFCERTGFSNSMNRVIEEMATKLKVDEMAVMSYLLRLCYDKWVEACGKNIEDVIKSHVSKFRINIAVDHHKEMMKKYVLVCERIGYKPQTFDAAHFLRTILFASMNGYTEKSYYPNPWTPGIPECQSSPEQIASSLTNLSKGRSSLKTVFKEFMESLTSTNGSNYRTHINFWSNLYHDILPQSKILTDPNDDEFLKNEHLINNFQEGLNEFQKNGFVLDLNNTYQRREILRSGKEAYKEIDKLLPELLK